jgi:hypothetical protein
VCTVTIYFQRLFSVLIHLAFGLVFAKTGSINLGTGLLKSYKYGSVQYIHSWLAFENNFLDRKQISEQFL